MKKELFFIACLCIFLISASTASANIQEMADELMEAYKNGKAIPLMHQIDANLDMDMAYAIQRNYVRQRLETGDFIQGFKVGFTNTEVQKKYGVNAPAAGVLYGRGTYYGSPVVELSDPPGLIIETEIGYLIGETITNPLKDIAELKGKVSGLMPVIELPNMGFADMELLKGVDVIAANAASDGQIISSIVGKEREVGNIDLNDLVVTLYKNGKLVHQGLGSDALGDQWQTALWLVNEMVKQGYEIKPGYILITGALGQVAPALPGYYEAFWGPLGKISFKIKEPSFPSDRRKF
ncbi:MAG TPA: hypothetical protein PKV93_10735 [Fervidobacterium sp.]|nr:hypothetical protein [Fervidobacterium sp.]